MTVLTQGIHTHTPTLTVADPRGLDVRSVTYYRAVQTTAPEERINRSAYDAMGRLVEQWDPRLWALKTEDAATPANLSNRYSLSGKILGSMSVDAGERISLFGDADQLVETWDSRETERRVEYDDLLRPLAVYEQGKGEAARCTERYEYAAAGTDFAAHNQCGQVIRHDDPAGTQTLDEYALTGGILEQTQRFLHALEAPDWPQALPERDALLEPVAQAATSATRFNPLGDVLEQVDAKGNRQLFDYTVDGLLFASHLQLSGQATPRTLVGNIAYNAYSQVEQETAGNGVVSTLTYRAEDGRLLRLHAARDADAPLQDLRYAYDPVGNVLSLEDAALPIRYFANQRVEPIKRYDYDSLYQLTKATGWEAGSASRGPGFNRFDDPGAVANYQQTYHYDAGGNLLELIHVGPQSHSRKLTAARYSNRCLPEHNDRPPTEDEIAAAFDGNGNLLELQPGQVMSWDLRNQLHEVRPVERESDDDDRELYFYGGDGMRRRKVRSTQTNARSLISEVRYLPGLEIRTRQGTGEVLHVICVQAGRSAMQVLHWETAPPDGMSNDQYRYSLTDHLGSSSLELDGEAGVISRETYHPYGSTAWFAGRSEVEASYKTVRYSGKERDATGLYYYGFRYYATWLQRWVNPDPAEGVDGLNIYRMVKNSPISYNDIDGLMPTKNAGEINSKDTPEAEIEVNRFNRFHFLALLSKKKIKVFDESLGDYKPSDDFEAVEVGIGSREQLLKYGDVSGVTSDELKDTLTGYKNIYRDLITSSILKGAEDATKQKRNFELGVYISGELHTWMGPGEKMRKTDLLSDKKRPDNRLFALLKKSDLNKEPADRKIYGITLVTLNFPYENESNNADLRVDFTVIDPGSQLSSAQLHRAVAEGRVAENTLSIRGAGTYLTMNALKQVNDVNVKKIRAQAANPRSAAMALGWGERRPL
ncbi:MULTISPECIES: RHS repeat domain-containing protein [unclassified Pseudomonas]|uniref:RHS repeat domain-containing protein n=1 Tax=unclassified Pseudomonas TaxID=196821 RepID=UPI000CD2DC56|nr:MULTISPECIES: RHS repeat-associated core domain-containing protein [unclassified Pseudomonas]POA13163.1 toxin [Pseudomonas sp. MPBD7-1]